MNVAVIGLGIIGGSFCKALKKYTDCRVTGINRTQKTAERALEIGAIDEIGTPEDLSRADIIILALYPQAAVEYIEKNGKYIKKGAIVTDSAGVKSAICPSLTALSEKYGFTFIGSHPMAGKEKNGFDVSDSELFKGASFIITPCGAEREKVEILSNLARALGFGCIKITTPQQHDRMIAFTSQLPHILACAYVLSPCCPDHKGFSAGSYRDVSRVADINSRLWSELFLENREPLIEELEILSGNILKITEAIKNEDKQELTRLLEEGHTVKSKFG